MDVDVKGSSRSGRSSLGRSSGGSVVAGSVWESRLKQGGIKVFGAYDDYDIEPQEEAQQQQPITSANTGVTDTENARIGVKISNGNTGRRKTWKSESVDGQVHILKGITVANKVSKDVTKKSLSEGKKGKLEVEGSEGSSPTKGRRRMAFEEKEIGVSVADFERKLKELRMAKLEYLKGLDHFKGSEIKEKNPKLTQVKKKSECVDASNKDGCDEICKDFGVCQEKVISCNANDVGNVVAAQHDDCGCEDEDEDFFDSEVVEKVEDSNREIEIGVKKHVDVKEIRVSEPSRRDDAKDREKTDEFSGKLRHNLSTLINHPTPVKKHAEVYEEFTKHTSSVYQPLSQKYLQKLMDLVMWQDVAKSALVFGIGMFIIISSFFMKSIDISSVSVISYLGLAGLCPIFLYRSNTCRSDIEIDDASYVLGEDEAIRLVKIVLPVFNNFLLTLKALFFGDPEITMKLGVLLFILARFGSSITIWHMAKLGFIGLFTLPKLCSVVSTWINAPGNIWIRWLSNAWKSWSYHIAVVAAAIFILVLNSSSIFARVWAVFMVYVGFRYYQQSLVRDGFKEIKGRQGMWEGQVTEEKGGLKTSSMESAKVKKTC